MVTKDSFDRFGEDLTELLLSFLSFGDRFRLESVCSEWQRVVFFGQKEILVKHFLHKMVTTSGDHRVIGHRFQTVLRKCCRARCLDLNECHSVANYDHLMQTIIATADQMKTIQCNFNALSRQTTVAFADKFCDQLTAIHVLHSRHIAGASSGGQQESADNHVILFGRCRRLRELKANLTQIIDEKCGRVLARNLHKVSVYYEREDSKRLEALIAANRSTLRAAEVFARRLDAVSADTLMSSLAIESLIDLNLGLSEDNPQLNQRIVKSLQQLGQKCRHLKQFRLDFQPKTRQLFEETIRSLDKHFRQLRRLELNLEMSEEIQLLSQSLSSCKRLTHLSIISTYNYVIKNSFFADIDRHLPRLQRLYVENGNGLTDFSILSLSRLSRLESIEFYGIKDHRITASCVHQILIKYPKITKFRINYVKYC